jgi:hypothetical protein
VCSQLSADEGVWFGQLALCIEEKARKQGVGGGQMTAPQGEDEQASTETQEEPDVSEVLETARMSSTAIDQIHDDLSTGNDSDEIWEDTMEEQAEMESVFGIGEERQKGLDGDSETKVLDSTHSLHSPVTQVQTHVLVHSFHYVSEWSSM